METDKCFRDYVNLIMSMSVDYRQGGITKATYVANLAMISKKLTDAEIIADVKEKCTKILFNQSHRE